MADPGSVSYLFNRKGVVIVPKASGVTEDDLLMTVLDAGADEVNDLGESFEVVSEATDMVAVRTAVEAAGWEYESADATFLPSVSVPLDEDGARKVFRLLEALEDSDDVQNVFANFDVTNEVMASLD
jgi:transcriptional/translational regulatory protein YebC/TACO1